MTGFEQLDKMINHPQPSSYLPAGYVLTVENKKKIENDEVIKYHTIALSYNDDIILKHKHIADVGGNLEFAKEFIIEQLLLMGINGYKLQKNNDHQSVSK